MRREGPDAVRLSAVCGVAAVRRARPASGPRRSRCRKNLKTGRKTGGDVYDMATSSCTCRNNFAQTI